MTNVCILKGRLCREPELSTTASGRTTKAERILSPARLSEIKLNF